MKNQNSSTGYKVRFWCEIVLAVFSVIMGIVFITQIADIYYSASDGVIYSREIVAARLKNLIAPIVIWIAMVIVCFALSVVYKVDKKEKKPNNTKKAISILKKKMPSSCPQGVEKEYKTFYTIERAKFACYVIASVFSFGTAIFAIVYLSIAANFSQDVNASILRLCKYVFPFIVTSFALFITAVIVEFSTGKKQLNTIKSIIVASKKSENSENMDASASKCYPLLEQFKNIVAKASKKSPKLIWATRIVVFIVAVIFIGLGVWNEGFRDVLYKAVNICTECIGLG